MNIRGVEEAKNFKKDEREGCEREIKDLNFQEREK